LSSFSETIHIAGKANHDVVNFFGEVSADDDAQIGNDLVSFFGLIHLGENVSVGRDMVAMFGMVHAPESVIVGRDRVAIPGVVLFFPLILLGLVVILIVSQVRAYRRRQYVHYYPFRPRRSETAIPRRPCTLNLCMRSSASPQPDMRPLRIVLPGGRGQVGLVLARHFQQQGHHVTVLTRGPYAAPWQTVHWDGQRVGPGPKPWRARTSA